MSDGSSKSMLPRYIDPRRFCQQGVVLRGFAATGEMPRLTEHNVIVESVQAELAFAIDEQRERSVKGKLAVKTQLQCQRCLELMPVDLDCDVSLAIVRDEEDSRNLPGIYDPWIVDGEETDLYALIEEEVLLNLPFVVYHEDPCGESVGNPDAFAEEGETNKQNPFQVLKQLKDKTKI